MRTWVLVVLALATFAVGGGVGAAAGFFITVFSRIATDVDTACLLLQKAETGRYLTREQRARLVDIVLPEGKTRDGKARKSGSGLQELEWYDWGERWRIHMKSGCPDA
jgi:hypothetical protein